MNTQRTPHICRVTPWLVPLALVLAVLAVAARCSGVEYATPYNAVCEVQNGPFGGSGTVVATCEKDNTALVLSCGHIFEQPRYRLYARKISVKFGNGWTSLGRCLGADFQRDLSAIEINRPPNVKPLKIVAARQQDAPFRVIGYPYFGGFRVVTAPALLRPYINWELRINRRVWSGFSGGAVVNANNELIGVCVTTSESYSSHVNKNAIDPFLKKWVK